LFAWGYDHIPCVRSPEAVLLAAQDDAAARKEVERSEAGEKAQAATDEELTRRSALASAWAAAGAGALLVLALVFVTMRWKGGEPQAGAKVGSREGRSISVGDSAISPAISTPDPKLQSDSVPTLARPLPEKPFPGQRQPPCIPRIEAVIRGVCWVELGATPPCGNNAYEWEGKCYIPSISPPRQPTSNLPQ
jgi:hypothetical protein